METCKPNASPTMKQLKHIPILEPCQQLYIQLHEYLYVLNNLWKTMDSYVIFLPKEEVFYQICLPRERTKQPLESAKGVSTHLTIESSRDLNLNV